MGLPVISHDVAFSTTLAVVRVFSPCLRDEEQRDAFDEVYPLIQQALLTFHERVERERERLFGCRRAGDAGP